MFSSDNVTSQSPKIQSTFTPERPRFTLLVQKMGGKGFIYFVRQHNTYFHVPKSKPKIETALLATKFLETKQITDNMINLHSPQHARLLGFDNVEEHQDSMKQVISALWKHNQACVTEKLLHCNYSWRIWSYLRQAVDVALVDELIMRRVCATLMNAKQVLIGHIC